MSVNSQGLWCPDYRKVAFSYFQQHRFDIILLQETQINCEWNGGVFINHGTNTARGVAILIHSWFDYNVAQTRRDNEGCILNILLNLEGHVLNIVNIYALQTDRTWQTFFSSLSDFNSEEDDYIIGGDLDCIPNARLDKIGRIRIPDN